VADFEDIADPALIARLAAWFGEAPPPPADRGRRARDAERARLAELEAAVDPALRRRLEAWTEAADAMLRLGDEPLIPRIGLESLAIAAEPRRESEELEYAQPDDIRLALREENTPQAVLRDLFRPVIRFGDIVLRPIATGLERLAEDPTRPARELMARERTSPLEPLPQDLIAQDLADLRELLARPWEDSKPENPIRASSVASYDHYQWFGFEGAYDPDQ
jgi:hypothetical protein